MESINHDGTTPKVKKSRSYLQLNNDNNMRPFNMPQPLSSMNQNQRSNLNILNEISNDGDDENPANYT